jgi:uncharacterized protein YPO0396
MSTDGFVLQRIEFYNWGNFHQWQVAEVSRPAGHAGPPGGLFGAERTNALLLGVNGAGKSTLIDAIIITLLPFEQAVKLGVVHDLEKGGASGRTISAYVLGKHGSVGEGELNLERAFARKNGMSATLLSFRHRSDPDRQVTVARMWWYVDHKLREESAGLVGMGDFSLGPNEGGAETLLDPEGKSYRSLRELKQDVQLRKLPLQVFDKNAAYFQALSSQFGNVRKDDLKLLNRAFFMKSIEQIDVFIRDHMLIESSNESMGHLISHVGQASEITANIERCEEKLSQIDSILKEFELFKKLWNDKKRLEGRVQLIGLYPDWIGLKDLGEKIAELKKFLIENQGRLPELIRAEEEITQEYERLSLLISQDDAAAALRELEFRGEALRKEITLREENERKIKALCEELELKPPKRGKELSDFSKKIDELDASFGNEREALSGSLAELTSEKDRLTSQGASIRAEVKHLSEHSTQIESGLYRIKLECQKELGLPEKSLSFVGELIEIREGQKQFERAIEAALQPISRNLLCHPDYLDKVTKWVNSNGLNRTLTIKRIQPKEMEPILRAKFDDDCILSKIQILPIKENPFFHYLWEWLGNSFDHRVVEVNAIKKTEGRAVTVEGLVKSDPRTMKKLKKEFEFSLGWDNEEKINGLIRLLNEIQVREEAIQTELSAVKGRLRQLETLSTRLAVLRDVGIRYLDLPELKQSLGDLDAQVDELEKKSKKLADLKRERIRVGDKLSTAQKDRILLEDRLKKSNEELPFLVRKRESDQTSFNHQIELILPLFPEYETELTKVRQDAPGGDWRSLQGEIREDIVKLEARISQSRLSSLLDRYEKDHHDPDLHYGVPHFEEIDRAREEWMSAKDELEQTGLPQARRKWVDFYNMVLFDSMKTAIHDIRAEQHAIKRNILSINEVLKMTDYERLPSERRYLQIVLDSSMDERIRKFNADLKRVEKTLVSDARALVDRALSSEVMEVLQEFVLSLEGPENAGYFSHVTDVRNHFRFAVHSFKRGEVDEVVEKFTGSRGDAKSSGQTVQLAYVLLASSLAYRFNFHDPVRGKDSLRLIVLDEFGGKLDNEKPRDIVRLLDDLGFQSIFVSPMSKADLRAEYCGNLIFCHKLSASQSKMGSTAIESRSIAEIQKSMGLKEELSEQRLAESTSP